ncbi:MAG: 3-oxoacyl-[acyl-carrier-protein] reductase [Armatimonadetes bacterium]|nr:3-oxoacyl-[acyl-carrier-protein] reductase [Armatimonadota bacterium]
MSLEGKVALVTGASRGIGREIAKQLALAGASVACVATAQGNAQGTADEIAAAGGRAEPYGCDVGDTEAVKRTVQEATEVLGPPTILVNNAGVARDALMMRMGDDDWDRVLDVNLKGAFNCIKACQKGMMKARWGRIVNISSIVGLHGAAGQANYAASKAGLIGLTLAVAKELGSRNVTCNAVAPGFIETDMTAKLSQEVRDYVASQAPLGRLGSPQDIAPLVVFLCGDQASYITGQTLTVDGGLTI